MKKIFKLLFSRIFVIGLLLIVQLVAIFIPFILLGRWGNSSYVFNIIYFVIGLLVLLYVIKQDIEPGFKLTWSIVILLFPLFGAGIYFIFGDKQHTNKKLREGHKYKEKTHHLLISHTQQQAAIQDHSSKSIYIAKYLENQGFPAYNNTETEYYPWGQDKFKQMLEDLKNAKEFIFLEYFIVNNEGIMWNSILEILKQKVKEGVEVRFIYDGFGSVFTLPSNYDKKMNSYGIKTRIFNKITPLVTFKINNRDHRKILVIDGKYGYTGGINLADEYINKVNRFGVWKDTAVRLHGDAVYSLTFMFLQTWNSIKDDKDNYLKYYIKNNEVTNNKLVIPYGDDPTDKETIGETVYMNILNRAKDYVYLTTPYLICDNTITTALTIAAKSGIDVRIIVPGIFDKKMVSWLTKSSYESLLNAGVRIFEYTKGFVHAKEYVSDDSVTVIGTINMDYRSLYHHFECATYIEDKETAADVKKDFINTMNECKEIKLENLKHNGFIKRLLTDILRIFAPLL